MSTAPFRDEVMATAPVNRISPRIGKLPLDVGGGVSLYSDI